MQWCARPGFLNYLAGGYTADSYMILPSRKYAALNHAGDLHESGAGPRTVPISRACINHDVVDLVVHQYILGTLHGEGMGPYVPP